MAQQQSSQVKKTSKRGLTKKERTDRFISDPEDFIVNGKMFRHGKWIPVKEARASKGQ